MAKKTKKKPEKKVDISHLGLVWQTMKVGVHRYEGTAKGGKANASRAGRLYSPKKWRTFTKAGEVFVERLS